MIALLIITQEEDYCSDCGKVWHKCICDEDEKYQDHTGYDTDGLGNCFSDADPGL